MGQENIELSPYIRGFESDSPESLGEKITTFLTENSALELKEVKYSSYGFIHNQ
jgi:hypothetical protein